VRTAKQGLSETTVKTACGCGKNGSAFNLPALAECFSSQEEGETGTDDIALSSDCLPLMRNLPARHEKSCPATRVEIIARRISTAEMRQNLTGP
jgi:ABC-type phosphate transport system substrate-binding protein